MRVNKTELLSLFLTFSLLLTACESIGQATVTDFEDEASAQNATDESPALSDGSSNFDPGPREEMAAELEFSAESGSADAGEALSDSDIDTSVNISHPNGFYIHCSHAEFSAMYFIWEERPEDFEIIYSDGTRQLVEGGMLHQVVRLTEPASEISLEPASDDDILQLSELRVFSGGSLPGDVQDWQKMGDGEADILLFPTHADDEYVCFGGILPYYAGELGYKVQVCYTCCHDNEYHRNHELLNALWKTGCVYYPEINFTAIDVYCEYYSQALRKYSFRQFEEYEVEMIRRFKPLVVVSHDESGEYGHGAHILTAMTLEQAIRDAANPLLFKDSAQKYGAWQVLKTYLHLYGDDPTVISFDTTLESFGGMTLMDAALECYSENVSQLEFFTVYGSDSPYDASKFGLFSSMVGEDTRKNDLMENIDKYVTGLISEEDHPNSDVGKNPAALYN